MVTTASIRDRGGDEPPAGAKRARTSLDQEECKSNAPEAVQHVPYERLKNVSLPYEITALPHVLSLLDTLLMTPEEALREAIVTNHLKPHRLDVVNLILRDIFTGSGASSTAADAIEGDIIHQILEKGAMSAARNGHVALVERLLPLMIDLSRNTTNYLLYWFNQVLKILDEGTVHGHLPVVEFMVQHASNNDYADRFLRWPTVNTLSKAILAGHLHVAEFLINQRVISWNLQDAFTVALDKGEMSLAERLREVYPQQMPGQNLFIDLASSGQLHALEYLYNNGCNDPELIGLAFTFAVTQALVIANVNLIKAHRQVVEFLLGTGCVTSEAFENTFKTACSENDYTCIDTVKLLYKWNRASPQCIDRAFGLANNFTVLKMLYENEKISEKAITGAFENAVRLQHKEHSDILLFLYKQPCIPSNLIEKAFLRAVKFLNAVYPGDGAKTKTRIVTCLRDDERLSSKAMGEAFVDAVKSCNKDMMTLLYDERRTPPEFLVKAFVEAVHRKETGLVKDILKLLTVEEYVPRELMHEIFVAAARHGQMLILELVCESLPADLPLEVLKNALDIAGGNHKIENYIRKMVCDQVFKEQA